MWFYLAFAYNRRSREIASMRYPSSVQVWCPSESVDSVIHRVRFLPIFTAFPTLFLTDRSLCGKQTKMRRLTTTSYRMKVWTKENYLKILEEDKNMAAEPGTSGANVSLSAADFKSLALAILNVSKRLDKLQEKPSATGKSPGKLLGFGRLCSKKKAYYAFSTAHIV